MGVPLHQAKAELFRTLGHPVRVRVLELLLDGPCAVHQMLAEIEVEASSLSQQLGVLRRARLVSSERQGTSVNYTLSSPEVAAMMGAARQVLTRVLSDQEPLLNELRAESSSL